MIEPYLRRIEEREPSLHAFAWLDLERARRLAAAAHPGPLQGVPVGVKDIIDTAGIPTECGSALFGGRVPDRSAAVVERLEAAGAVIVGKTVTAELAYFTPGPTRNPWNLERTPGGSSMGSAAAVAAGMLELAVGTQTNGSVIRPAAFCGVVGYKPSAGLIPRDGVLTFSETLDQVGGFARSVADAARLCGVLAATGLAPEPVARPRLAVLLTAEWKECEPAARERFEADLERLGDAAGGVERPAPPDGFEAAAGLHRTIMAAEAARALGPAVSRAPELVSRRLRDLLEEGSRIPEAEYAAALAARRDLIERFAGWAAPYDALLSPPVLGEAPGLESTGDPRLCTRWTLLGAPALALPTGRGPAGLPLGLQLTAAPGADRRLLGVAAWAETYFS